MGGRLAIRLNGHYYDGIYEGQAFTKFVQCGSAEAVERAEKPMKMLDK